MSEATEKSKYESAMNLLHRAADNMEDHVPDNTWLYDYYMLTGTHMILTEEGWEPGDVKQSYLDDWSRHPKWSNPILDEVNAPVAE